MFNVFIGYPLKVVQFKVKPCGLSRLTWIAILGKDIRVLRGNPLRLLCQHRGIKGQA